MSMKGNFKNPLKRKDGGATVTAKGWIFWDEVDPTVQTVRVGATIAQHEGTPQERYGTGWSEEPYERPRPGDDQRQEWRCDVHEDDGRRFGAGSSVAGAVLVSTNPSWIWPWGATPTVD